MNNGTVTYRTAGSAALKPEYVHNQAEPTPIIEFEALAATRSRQRVYRAPREVSFAEKVANKMHADPFLGSMSKAFNGSKNLSRANKMSCIRYIASVSLGLFVLIALGL